MGKKDLKKQYPELNFNFVDLISLLDTTPTKKMTPFLVKQFHEWIQYRPNEKMESSEEFQEMRRTLGDTRDELDEIVKRMLFKWARPKLGMIREFIDHMENNRLPENDINKYDNWNSVRLAVNEAELKSGIKNKRNKILILHQDDEWFILKPLSIEASVNYGYGTKWCTSMRTDNSYFHKYSKDGVLLFVINRKNGLKYAFYSSPKEYSVWTMSDARIDSMETTIPFDLLIKIKDWTNYSVCGPNYDYFEEEDKHQPKLKVLRTVGLAEIDDSVDEAPMPEPTEALHPHNTYVGEVEEVNQVTFEPELTEDVESYDEEDNSIFISLRDDEPMVGLGHPVHGSITEQGERTWSNPYPNGIGGGFEDEMVGDIMDEMPEEMMERAIPADRETAEMMGRAYNEDELPQQAG